MMFRRTSIFLFALLMLCGCSNSSLAGNEILDKKENPLMIDRLELKFQTEGIRSEIKPSKPQGYYPHYKKQEGYHYHVLYGSLKNTSDEMININQLKVEGINEEERYQGKLVLINKVESYFWEEIGPGTELDFYVFSLVKDDKQNPNEYRFYYDSDWKSEEEQEFFDFEIRYRVPMDLGKDDGD